MKNIKKQLIGLLFVMLFAVEFSVTAFAANTDFEKVKLNALFKSGNTAFAVENMFPGDAETKDFTVKVNHKRPITLYYHANIKPGSEKLAEVLMVKIELPEKGVTLYEGLMGDMPDALEHRLASDEKEVLYRITAYLETSVGNEYQFQTLTADFRWWYKEESGTAGGGNGDFDSEGSVKPIEPGEADNPDTGDNSNIVLYLSLFIVSVAALAFLLILIKRKKGEEA